MILPLLEKGTSFCPGLSYVWKGSADQEMAIQFSQARFKELKWNLPLSTFVRYFSFKLWEYI